MAPADSPQPARPAATHPAVSDFTINLTVNGLPVAAHFPAEILTCSILPLVQKIVATQPKLVLLAGPPGSGKSTLSLVIEALAQQAGYRLQALGMDGFHHTNAWLADHHLSQVKGAPETFDFDALAAALVTRDQWPVYSRQLHDVSPRTVPVTGDTLLVEGNYLLYDAHPWNTLAPLADLTVFLDAEKPLLRRRLIQRKMAGGLSRDEAQRFYERSDARNVDLVLDCHLPADVTLHL